MKWTIFLLCIVFLCGCGRKATETTAAKVVVEITVTHETHRTVSSQIYTDSEKLRQILTAIRQLGQKFNPTTDPESLPQETFHILLRQSDGTTQLYRTKADRYIRFNQQPWQETDPDSLTRLTKLLKQLPGDTLIPPSAIVCPRAPKSQSGGMPSPLCGFPEQCPFCTVTANCQLLTAKTATAEWQWLFF